MQNVIAVGARTLFRRPSPALQMLLLDMMQFVCRCLHETIEGGQKSAR